VTAGGDSRMQIGDNQCFQDAAMPLGQSRLPNRKIPAACFWQARSAQRRANDLIRNTGRGLVQVKKPAPAKVMPRVCSVPSLAKAKCGGRFTRGLAVVVSQVETDSSHSETSRLRELLRFRLNQICLKPYFTSLRLSMMHDNQKRAQKPAIGIVQ
jgi:hypothetical protein